MNDVVIDRVPTIQMAKIFDFLNKPEILQEILKSHNLQELFQGISDELESLGISSCREFEEALNEYIRSGYYIGDNIDLESTVNAASYTTALKIQRT
ncbi:MAG: hypothetical protein Q4C58_10785 [Eubacteriales bacterium]|nr:hypothetical protein [Eubacteriales bacterium]